MLLIAPPNHIDIEVDDSLRQRIYRVLCIIFRSQQTVLLRRNRHEKYAAPGAVSVLFCFGKSFRQLQHRYRARPIIVGAVAFRFAGRRGKSFLGAALGTGDAVLVPHGWHGPSMAAPGYDLYYLNVMAGPERVWRFTVDPDHRWLMNWDPSAPRARAGRCAP